MTIKYKLAGKAAGVLVGSDAHSLVSVRQPQVTATFNGFEGDKHSGMTHLSGGRTPWYPRGTEIRNDRQVSIVSKEELEQIARLLGIPEILPEWLGANLLLEGIPNLSLLPPNTRLFFSHGAVLVVTQENNPCVGPGKIIRDQYHQEDLEARFTKAAYHQRGVVACVDRSGTIHEGEDITVEVPDQVVYTL